MIKLAISGCLGRMGTKITQLALRQPKRFEIHTLLEHPSHPKANQACEGVPVSADSSSLKGSDVLIEFTLPEGTLQNLRTCVEQKIPMVIGTTGLTPEQKKEVKKAAEIIPIIYGTNMSIGVNVLFKATELVAKKLQGAMDISIYEEHHIHKKDSPSGTAKTLAEIAEEASKQKAKFNPEPLREGEIIGNHEIAFETEFDTFKMYHHAKDRAMFALGALEAAHYLAEKKPGLYSMQQVLGLDQIKV
ncbi:MAG: 4-hydroxy-tetrahydrodipicolinate reductase [Candidatus Zapsychrus exili]|nr:4-hydroxy-tetrahydrodipicolinate reductase [Candidatus Zapsychrus exili]